jgi:hypothetical protein
MYKTPEERLKLSYLVPKLRKEAPKPAAPTRRPKADITAARGVLERLMAGTNSNELLSVTEM